MKNRGREEKASSGINNVRKRTLADCATEEASTRGGNPTNARMLGIVSSRKKVLMMKDAVECK